MLSRKIFESRLSEMPFPGLWGEILQNSDGQKINDIVTMIPLAFGQSYCKPLSRFNMHG
jgi:hypothetical protein